MFRNLIFIFTMLLSSMVWGQEFSNTQVPYIQKNFIKNAGAEGGVSGYTRYADAAATSPVDGIGGSPNVTLVSSSTTPISGNLSLVFSKDAVNRQGQGFAVPFTIDKDSRNKVLQTSFSYEVVSGTYADNDMSVWIYDVTNSTLIQPAPYLIKNVLGVERMGLEFQATGSTSYRLIFHIGSTSALAYSLRLDNFFVGPQAKLYGSPVSDEISATYTLSNSGNATVTGTLSRIGKKGVFKGRISIGSSLPTGAITLNLPTGITFNTFNSFANASISAFSGTNNYTGSAFKASASSVTFYGPTTTDFWNATRPATWASGHYIDFTITEEVFGWGSTTLMSNDADTRVVAARYILAGAQTFNDNVPTVVVWNSLSSGFDTHAAMNTSNGRYYFPVSGKYSFNAGVGLGASTSIVAGNRVFLLYRINGGAARQVQANLFTGSISETPQISGGDTVDVNVGDYLEILGQFDFGAASYSINSANGGTTYFSIQRVSGPSQIAASENVSASYWLSANQAVTANSTVINYDSKEFDTHNAVTTGAGWRFTAPISGEYAVTGHIDFTAGTYLMIYKGGSVVKSVGYCAANFGAEVTGGIRLLAGEYIEFRSLNSATILGGTLSNASTSKIYIRRVGNY